MLDQPLPKLRPGKPFSPVEPGLPAETSHGRSNGRTPGSVRWGVSKRSLKVRRLLREQDQAGALPAALTISRDAKSRCRPRPTDLAAVVQLRLRIAIGLQALKRCSGLLNRRARGSTVAAHHFASVVKLLSSSASNGESAGGSPAGCTIPFTILHDLRRFDRRRRFPCARKSSIANRKYEAALAQLPEALRSERRGRGWKSLTRHQFQIAPVAQGRGSGLKPRAVSVQS
jgi:hypothetical protein